MFNPFMPSPHFDAQIADFRTFYHNMTEEERRQYRGWLEKVSALEQELEWEGCLKVNMHIDECDEEGETIRWADVEFSSNTLLAATRAWDAGKPYCPNSNRP